MWAQRRVDGFNGEIIVVDMIKKRWFLVGDLSS